MTKKNNKKVKNIDFSKITPKIQITPPKNTALYEKALLKSDEESSYSRNTSTWD